MTITLPGVLSFATSIVVVFTAAWFMLRCTLGYHDHPLVHERALDDKKRPDPYKLNWRCLRCGNLARIHFWSRELAFTEQRPHLAIKTQIYRDRKAAAAKIININDGNRKRA